MITIPKLKEYETSQGNEDGYTRAGGFQKNIITWEEWSLISRLAGEYKLVIRNIASDEYAEAINKEIVESCDDFTTVEYLKRIAGNHW